ncbi:MAG: SUMF1/EgtB/PvdO family nonheme iron enzyme [Polyangiaceae bacterium]|nr:SUMF1/EgtB/PvdO family nonheme iron enzyme [Polyangiaceae bacterium]
MNWNVVLVVGPLALAGCSIFGSEDGQKNDGVIPGTGAAGGAGGAGGAGAAGSGAAGGGGAKSCGASAGPAMIAVPSPGGGTYCIDRTEVTQAQYAEFLAAPKMSPGSENADCADNKSYQPVAEASSYEPATCIAGVSWTPKTTPERPVVCIDWCDAYAYCKWAGKRLCGKVGGGGLEIAGGLDTPADPANDAAKSQWFNACSQGGKTQYAYGDAYDPAACGGEVDSPDWESMKKNVGARAGCHGATEPWAQLRDLNGSVSEYTDECFVWVSPSSGKGTKHCALRGGSMTDEKKALGCPLTQTPTTDTAAPQRGFRCCRDI